MKKTAFIFSVSNLFTISSQSALAPSFDCHVLNMRYANEEMSRDEHFIQQIQELFNDNFVKRGLIFTKHEYMFTEALMNRINSLFHNHTPSILFFEMSTMKASEWMVLEYIREMFKVPIAVYTPSSDDNDKIVFRLMQIGVKEVMTRMDSTFFEKVANREFGSHS